MGYLPGMFKSPIKGFRQYLLCIGQNREAVVYALNDAGEPVTLTCGKVEDVLGHAFNEISPDFRLKVRLKYAATSGLEETPLNYGMGASRWRELAGVMNGKGFRSGYAAAEYRAVAKDFRIDYIKDILNEPPYRRGNGPQFVVTPAGEAADAASDAKEFAENQQKG